MALLLIFINLFLIFILWCFLKVASISDEEMTKSVKIDKNIH